LSSEGFSKDSLPPAGAVPSEQEMEAIKAYLNRKYPLLLKNSPRALEGAVNDQ
jgi:hypothetical protein